MDKGRLRPAAQSDETFTAQPSTLQSRGSVCHGRIDVSPGVTQEEKEKGQIEITCLLFFHHAGGGQKESESAFHILLLFFLGHSEVIVKAFLSFPLLLKTWTHIIRLTDGQTTSDFLLLMNEERTQRLLMGVNDREEASCLWTGVWWDDVWWDEWL